MNFKVSLEYIYWNHESIYIIIIDMSEDKENYKHQINFKLWVNEIGVIKYMENAIGEGELDIKSILKKHGREDLRFIRNASYLYYIRWICDNFYFPLEELQRMIQHENQLTVRKEWPILLNKAKESFQSSSLPFRSRTKGFLSFTAEISGMRILLIRRHRQRPSSDKKKAKTSLRSFILQNFRKVLLALGNIT